MGAGVPLTKKCISDIVKTIAEDNKDISYGLHGPIPHNLLYADTSAGRIKLVWYRPPEKRHAYFSASVGIEDGDLIVPGLLYIVENDKMFMYAFKGTKPKSKLYRAPFMNVGEGNVCLGNAKISKPAENTFQNIIQYWEEMFWRSEFSHILGTNPINGNLSTITKDCIKNGKAIPSSKLIAVKMTLNDILK